VDNSRGCHGRPTNDGRVIFVDTGHAFFGKPTGAVLGFYLIQESVLEVDQSINSSLDISDSVSGTPIYRVRNFVNVEDAKRYMFADAID
jgi:hypothetical protein